MNKDKTLTRDQIQERFVDWFVDEMDEQQVREYLKHMIGIEMDDFDDVEVVKECQTFAPHLIEGITLSV